MNQGEKTETSGQEIAIMRRLSFIKYLYTAATEQSRLSQPVNAAAVLIFHDSVELFLHLACEKSNIDTSNTDFKGYWTKLNPKYPPEGLSQHASMMRLNKARVGLKHSGILPSNPDIEGFRASTTNFFTENTPRIFGIPFSEISLVHLVESEEARAHLRTANDMVDRGDIEPAFSEVALALYEVIHRHEDLQRGRFGGSPFSFHGRSYELDRGLREIGIDAADFIDTIDRLSEAMKVLALGLDYTRYVRFIRLTPTLHEIIGGKPRLHERHRDQPRSLQDYKYCFDFVIESALAIQEA